MSSNSPAKSESEVTSLSTANPRPCSEAGRYSFASGTGLTSPEFAVQLAYVKIALEDEILATSLPDDEWTNQVLQIEEAASDQGRGASDARKR